MPPRSGRKLERPKSIQEKLYFDILQSQQTDTDGDLADTLLVCDGGMVKVHAFLLQAASPFLRKAIASQGENYPYVREILLPDFAVKDVERVMSLIYTGYADLASKSDIDKMKEILQFFQVTGIDIVGDEIPNNSGGPLKIQELNRIPQDIFKHEKLETFSPKKVSKQSSKIDVPAPKVVAVVKADKGGKRSNTSTARPVTNEEVKSGGSVGRSRSGRPQRKIVNLSQTNEKESESEGSDFKEDIELSSSSDESLEESKPKSKRPTSKAKKSPVVKLTSVQSTAAKQPNVTTLIPKAAPPTNTYNYNRYNHNSIDRFKATEDDDSGTDSEDDDWVKPNFKDRDWFDKESKRCQCCSKVFEKPAKASLCVTSHKNLRCYFCFRVYTSTDILFKHFKRRHKQAGKESTLICPYCDQAVPYKSVSCHVISVHLRSKLDERENANSSSAKPVKMSPAKPAIAAPPPPVTPKPAPAVAKKRGPRSVVTGSTSRRRSRSGSTSSERMSSNERQPTAKKIKRAETNKTDTANDNVGNVKKTTQLNINLKQLKDMLEQKKKDESQKKEKIKVRDLDLTLEKSTTSGRKLVFRIQKTRIRNMD